MVDLYYRIEYSIYFRICLLENDYNEMIVSCRLGQCKDIHIRLKRIELLDGIGKSGNIMIKNCKTCRWAGCKHYGKNMGSCENYIPSLEEE